MSDMILCPYCGRPAALHAVAHCELESLRRCAYCGEEVCDSEEALKKLKNLKFLSQAMAYYIYDLYDTVNSTPPLVQLSPELRQGLLVLMRVLSKYELP